MITRPAGSDADSWDAVASPAQGIQAARRRLGIDVETLALMADVSVDDARAVEVGDAVPEGVLRSLAGALNLSTVHPMAVHSTGMQAPLPQDAEHAMSMALLATGAGRDRDALAFPDPGAWQSCSGWSQQGAEEVVTRWRRTNDKAILALGAVGLVLVMGIWAATLASGCPLVSTGMGILVAWAGILAVAASVTWRVNRDLKIADAEHDGYRSLSATRAELRSRGYVATPDALHVLTVEGGVVREVVHRVETIRDATAARHGDGHVTVTVSTTGGTVTMPWLPRSPGLLDAVASWADARATRPLGIGIAYVSNPEPRTDASSAMYL